MGCSRWWVCLVLALGTGSVSAGQWAHSEFATSQTDATAAEASFASAVVAASQGLPQEVNALGSAKSTSPNQSRSDPRSSVGSPLQDRYILMLKPGYRMSDTITESMVADMVGTAGGRVEERYRHVFDGVAVSMPPGAAKLMASHPAVAYLGPDTRMFIGQSEVDALPDGPLVAQSSATWGLDRVDQRRMPLNRTYFFQSTGQGVTAYVIDTGILSSHVDFNGRVVSGFTSVRDGRGTSDCNGHGTHVAATLGGRISGVAKGVSLVPVRVLDCEGAGPSSAVIAGLDWILANAKKPAVVNLSLSGFASPPLDAAVNRVIDAGIPVVIAAGNQNTNACNRSPSRVSNAITVGATTANDTRSGFSNFGSCLDVFAPGTAIVSAWATGNTAAASLSGTSMAAPHVAGMAALTLATNPGLTPAEVASRIVRSATPSLISDAGPGSPNRLAFSLLRELLPLPTSIRSISVRSINTSTGWVGAAQVAVRDLTTNTPATGVRVVGRFSDGPLQTCNTGEQGTCVLVSGVNNRSQALIDFQVTELQGDAVLYDASQNAVTQRSIPRPPSS